MQLPYDPPEDLAMKVWVPCLQGLGVIQVDQGRRPVNEDNIHSYFRPWPLITNHLLQFCIGPLPFYGVQICISSLANNATRRKIVQSHQVGRRSDAVAGGCVDCFRHMFQTHCSARHRCWWTWESIPCPGVCPGGIYRFFCASHVRRDFALTCIPFA